MTRRVLTVLFGALLACGLAAQEPGGDKDKGAEPPRLKKKKRDGAAPPEAKKEEEKPKEELPKEEPPKDEKPGKGKEPPVKGGKGKEGPAKDDPIVPEDGERGDPGEDDKEILERISKNMRAVEDKLGNKELGEPTEQQQRDILKDIDALIHRNEQGGGGGGGGGADDKDQDKDDKDQDQKQGGGGGGGEKQGGGKSRAQQRKEGREQAKNGGRQRREIKSRGKSGGTKMAGGKDQPQARPMPGEGGDEPGAGKGGPRNDKMKPEDLAKEVWGHLPESLRAEMNAYSNPQPFMPKYDDLIKKYYKAIAEKGRKKGD
ncbi:MAG: hypothetical protein ACRC33_30230 [Gemmataceae bacterium]